MPPKQQQQQKRKGDAAPQQPQAKKAKETPAAPAAQQQKKPQGKEQKQQQQKKKAPEPEPESEEEEEEEEDEERGEVDEAALAAVEKVTPEMEKISAQLDAFDEQMQKEIFAIQKKFLLKKRPILAQRDAVVAKVPGLWKKLLTEHTTFIMQCEDVDREIMDNLTNVEIEEKYTDAGAEKQQIAGITVTFTFSAGNKHVKAGKFVKNFNFNDDSESLECVPTPAKEQPFVKADSMSKDSFFYSWFNSEGEDDGILAAQEALGSELYLDPLAMYRHVAEGGNINDINGDDDEPEMVFEESDEDDDEAPQLA